MTYENIAFQGRSDSTANQQTDAGWFGHQFEHVLNFGNDRASIGRATENLTRGGILPMLSIVNGQSSNFDQANGTGSSGSPIDGQSSLPKTVPDASTKLASLAFGAASLNGSDFLRQLQLSLPGEMFDNTGEGGRHHGRRSSQSGRRGHHGHKSHHGRSGRRPGGHGGHSKGRARSHDGGHGKGRSHGGGAGGNGNGGEGTNSGEGDNQGIDGTDENAGSAGGGELRGGTNAEKAFNYLVDKGLTRAQSAGVVGNLIQENHNLDPRKPGDGGNSVGIAQWNGPRKRELIGYAKEHGGTPFDLKTQLDFMWHELNGKEGRALQGLRGAGTPEQAALSFSRLYERPGDPMNENRVRNARSAFNSYGRDSNPSRLASR